MAVLWLRALRRFDDLDAQSKLRFGAHLGRFLRFADSLYLNVLDVTLDKRLWRGYERTNGRHGGVSRLPNMVGHTKTLAHGRVPHANRPTHSNRQTDDLRRLPLKRLSLHANSSN